MLYLYYYVFIGLLTALEALVDFVFDRLPRGRHNPDSFSAREQQRFVSYHRQETKIRQQALDDHDTFLREGRF